MRRLFALVAASVPVVLFGCSSSTPRPDTPDPLAFSVPAEIVFPAMDPADPYVVALCGLDMVATLDDTDPVASVIELLGTVQTSTAVQRDELAAIAAGLAAGAAAPDPANSVELHTALGLLRGRCAR
jgi:hypothetical protein